MSLWIFATLAAATFQTLRFMLQKTLASATLSASGATFARFLYSAPLVVALLFSYLTFADIPRPSLSLSFWLYGMIGGLSQIFATVLIVLLFKRRNFAVGTTFAKTEVILSVLVGILVLGEAVTWLSFLCILIGVVGVLLLSVAPDGIGWSASRIFNRAAGYGLGAGLLFAISGVTYRAASLTVASEDPLLRAGVTLAAVTSFQMCIMALWLYRNEPGEIARVWAARRTAGYVGLTSMGGSFFWFTAFTLQTAAYVKALGQVELILCLIASVVFFKETVTRRELAGIGLLLVSILGLVRAI